jgi:hypothetical protein
MKKVTVRLDDDLHRELRLRSVGRNEPVQRMMLRLLRAELKRGGRRGGETDARPH